MAPDDSEILLHSHELYSALLQAWPSASCHLLHHQTCYRLHSLQDTEAALQQARAESDGRLAAMRKGLLAAEDAERAELEKEYK